jgi:hypothetical protein
LNLLFNHASLSVDVYSHIPYEGRVDLKIKEGRQGILVRMPEWIGPTDKVNSTVNLNPRAISWQGRYIDLGPAKRGDRLTVRFPISERTLKNEKIGNRVYTLRIRGNNVVSVDPPGKQCPMYARSYQEALAPQRAVRRFLPNDDIAW